jgi:hypothetical protein
MEINPMFGHKYSKSVGVVAKEPRGMAAQSKQFSTNGHSPSKGRKPKTWGFYKSKNAAPSVCIVRNASGAFVRRVK